MLEPLVFGWRFFGIKGGNPCFDQTKLGPPLKCLPNRNHSVKVTRIDCQRSFMTKQKQRYIYRIYYDFYIHYTALQRAKLYSTIQIYYIHYRNKRRYRVSIHYGWYYTLRIYYRLVSSSYHLHFLSVCMSCTSESSIEYCETRIHIVGAQSLRDM